MVEAAEADVSFLFLYYFSQAKSFSQPKSQAKSQAKISLTQAT